MIKDYFKMLVARGIRMPIKYFLEAHLFDIINGTETHKRLPLSEYKYKTDNFKNSVQYQASWTSEIINSYKFLKEKVKLNEYTFFDIGCGKGKVLMVWAKELSKNDHKQKLIGIDNYQPFLKVAKKNIKKIKYRKKIVLINSSILKYNFSKYKKIILYLYNPFNKILLDKFITKIYKKKIIIIYNNTVNANHLKKKFNVNIILNKKSWHPNLCTKIFINKKI